MKGIGVVIGTLLSLAGAGLNSLVYSLNGGMPFRAEMWAIPPVAHNGKIPIWEGTRLIWLSDIIEIPRGWTSAGDVLLSGGLAVFAISSIIYLYHLYGRPGRVLKGSVRLSP